MLPPMVSHPLRTPATSALYIGALGVVFGDIGTSPLYTLRECFHAAHVALTPDNIMGILSCIAWSLMLVVTLKYVLLVMRSDNRGEGGILALTALAIDQFAKPEKRWRMLVLGLLGASLFYGDALITPAISVLSAVEGIKIATPAFSHWVIPLSVVILVGLFAMQRYGTDLVGKAFGPIMLVWFAAIGLLGFNQILAHPTILNALNPYYAFHFIGSQPAVAFVTLGAVVLAVTGGEALYADMGHFGRKPIQQAWLYTVFPALLLCYFGQGAMLIAEPEALENPFFHMVPDMLTIPMVILATLATVIASQAVISGAFSLTQQAIQLGYLPRMKIDHTSSHNVGHIYLPALNGLMLLGVLALVLGFRSSSNLAAAYGIAVTGTMLLTTILATVVMAHRNKWNPIYVGVFAGVFTLIDGTFLLANTEKIPYGGWFPLLFGLGIFAMMHTWVKGREALLKIVLRQTPLMDTFIARLDPLMPRIKRTAVFLTSDLNHAPPALVYNTTHNQVLHNQVIILKISRARIPRYPESERISITHHTPDITTVQATFGFMERPHIPRLLTYLSNHGLHVKNPGALSYFISSHTYIPSKESTALEGWEEPVFIALDSLSQSAVDYFNLPRHQVIELGNHIEI